MTAVLGAGAAAVLAVLVLALHPGQPRSTADLTTSAGPAARITSSGPPLEAAQFCGPSGVSASGDKCRISAALEGPQASSEGAPPLLASARPANLSTPSVQDAADPSVLVEGQTYFVFSTSAAFTNIPVAVVPAENLVPRSGGAPGFDIVGGTDVLTPFGTVRRTEAMPAYPRWAAPGGLWAPTVARFGQRFVMFFAAKRPSPPDPVNAECVGRATAEHPEGPYLPDPQPFTCGVGGVHGALDPSIFRAPDGRAYLHVAFGGTPTMLWAVPLTGAASAARSPLPLLRIQQRWETWFLENPSMVFDGRYYVLSYSVGDWKLPTYTTGLARCRTPTGPCRSSGAGPWLAATGDVTGPGGLSFFSDVEGNLMAAFHGYQRGRESLYGARSTFFRRVDLDGKRIALR